MSIEKEVTLYTLFQSLNALPEEFIDDAYDNVYQHCKLTDAAKDKFEDARVRYASEKTSPFVLLKILRLWRKEYYDANVKPLMPAPSGRAKCHGIDLNDSFCLTDIRDKAQRKLYKNDSAVIEDLSKVIRYIERGKTDVYSEGI